MDSKTMLEMAKKASENAYTPYSHYNVGAAMLGGDGNIYTGCNFENSSFGATICAERCAIGNMINNGCYKIKKAAIYVSGDEIGTCCGICRQVMYEFADGDIPVVFMCATGETAEFTINGLLPAGFRLKEE